jgi:hypothetical protein
MQTHAWMRRQKGADLLRLMSGEVVDDEVNRALARLRLDDRLQERDELVPGVTRHGAARHFARARVEGRIQRARAVAVILELGAYLDRLHALRADLRQSSSDAERRRAVTEQIGKELMPRASLSAPGSDDK